MKQPAHTSYSRLGCLEAKTPFGQTIVRGVIGLTLATTLRSGAHGIGFATSRVATLTVIPPAVLDPKRYLRLHPPTRPWGRTTRRI
jgi:hypothetical protein